jgi:hypothetical protein
MSLNEETPQTELRLEHRPAGRGKMSVTARFGEQVLHVDVVDPRKQADRSRFRAQLLAKYDGLARADDLAAQLDDELLRLATPAAAGPGDGGEPAPPGLDELYAVAGGRLCRRIITADGPALAPIANFDAAILEELVVDDGAEQARRLTIAGTLDSGEPLPPTQVTIEEFARGNWTLKAWGPRPTVLAGQGNADHLRAYLQLRSGSVPRRVVRAHTGWAHVVGTWGYLHAGGAIGPRGPLEGVEVELPDALAGFLFPEPRAEEALRQAVRAELALADGLAPDRVILPLLMTAWRAVVPGGCDFGTHLTGRTGCFKSELAALLQQHWGAGLDARHLPASWSSTGNALEALAFVCKDALLVVDDFAPAGSVADVARAHREAERLLRAQGNRSGRQRLRPDGTSKAARPPRGVVLSTGEDVPKGHSIRARLLIVEVGRDDVDVGRLTDCQGGAAAGDYAAAMGGYIAWLAARHDEVAGRVRGDVERLRAEVAAAAGPGQHRRTPTLVADLLIGAELYLQFAQDVGAVTAEEAAALRARCRAALLEVTAEQAEHHEAADPAGRYLALVRSALSSGRAYLEGPDGGHPYGAAEACGWRLRDAGDQTSLVATGHRIGWLVGADVYLDPDAAFAEVQRLAGEQNDPLPVTARALHGRLHERGALASTDEERGKLVVRRVLAGARRYVLHVRGAAVLGVDDGAHRAHSPEGQADSDLGGGPLAGSTGVEGPTVQARGQAVARAAGPDGPDGPLPRGEMTAAGRVVQAPSARVEVVV